MSLSRLRIAVIAAGSAVAVALTGCAASGSGSGAAPTGTVAKAALDLSKCDASQTTLKLNFGPQGAPAVTLAVAEMQKQYPGIKFDAAPSPTASYNDLTKQVVSDFAIGKPDDLINTGLGQLRFWVDTYHPAELDQASLPDGYQKQFLPAGTVDGKVYLAPFQVSAPDLIVNWDLLKQAGLGADTPLKSYDDFINAAKAVAAKTGKPSVNLSTDGLPDWFTQGLVQSAGGKYVNADGSAGFGDATGLKALGLWTSLAKDNLLLKVGLTDASAQFTAGNLPFLFATTSLVASLQKGIAGKFDWMPMDMPTVDGKIAGSQPAGGNGWVVLSQDECKAAYANKMINIMLGADVSLKASGAGYSYIPVNKKAADQLLAGTTVTPQLKYAWSYDKPLSVWGGFKGSATAQIFDVVTTMTQQLSNGADTASTVGSAVTKVNSIVGK